MELLRLTGEYTTIRKELKTRRGTLGSASDLTLPLKSSEQIQHNDSKKQIDSGVYLRFWKEAKALM